MSTLRTALAERVVVADGAMGTMLQASDATVDDFAGYEGCNEILNVTRPDIVTGIHEAYLEAGADCVTTNSFGANLGNLGEYGIAERIAELSEASARLARAAADRHATASRPRWVLGSIGPGTKLPTLGHTTFRELRDTYQVNAEALLRGGADALIIETCQDLLQAKAAIIGAKRAIARPGRGRAGHRPGHHRDHRGDAARQRDRRGADRARAARHRHDRAELRHRSRRDERAPALPGRARPDPDFLRAERRPAHAHRRRRALPADPGPARRRPRQVHQGVRPVPGGRLLRHHPRAHGRAGGPAGEPRGRQPQAAPRARGGLALPARAVPPGHRLPVDRRADQRQRVQGLPRGDARGPVRGLRADRAGADQGRRSPARRVRGLRGPGRRRRHARDRRPVRHRGHAAAGARLDRARRDRGGPGDDRRPRGHQLGQLRGRRRARLADRADDAAGARARRRRDRADHRRAGPGPHRRSGRSPWPSG